MRTPNVDRDRWAGLALRVVLPVLVLVAGALAFFMLAQEPEETKARRAPARAVRTKATELQVGSYRVIVKTNGIIQPQNLVTISAEVAGRVVKISPNFEVGASFAKGEVLMELDEENVTQQQILFEQALAEKIVAESEVEVAKTNIDEYENGTYLEERSQIEKTIFDAEELVKKRQLAYESAMRLAAKGTIRSLQLASAKFAVESAQKDLDLKKQQLVTLDVYKKTKVLQELNSALEAAKARLAAKEAGLRLEKQQLEREQIRAPFDGRVQQKRVGLGQQVKADTVLGEVIAVEYAEVRLPLARRDVRFLKLPEMSDDPPVEVLLRDAISPDDDNVWEARIVRTESALDPDSLDLFAIARIEDPFGLKEGRPILRIGQPVVAEIAGDELHDVVMIPRGAVRQLDRIFLIDKQEMTLHSATIEPIWSDDDYIVVRAGLESEDHLLATTQLVYAPEGSAVEIIPDVDAESSLANKLPTDN